MSKGKPVEKTAPRLQKTFTFQLSVKVAERLEAYAAANGIKVASLIKQMIESRLQYQEAQVMRRAKEAALKLPHKMSASRLRAEQEKTAERREFWKQLEAAVTAAPELAVEIIRKRIEWTDDDAARLAAGQRPLVLSTRLKQEAAP